MYYSPQVSHNVYNERKAPWSVKFFCHTILSSSFKKLQSSSIHSRSQLLNLGIRQTIL